MKARDGGKLVFGLVFFEGGNSLACILYVDAIVPEMM